jgi:dTDP-4-amino-4,6-dideoxygalactose transaminase
MIPVFDIRISRDDLAAVEETLRSGWLTMGPRTREFEVAFAEAIGARHAVAVASCTAALHLSYLAIGVGSGDEVIVPSFTMVATAAAVIHAGGTPVFADIVDPNRPTIDPDHVESLITPRTKAVVAMHFGGYAAGVERLAEVCRRHGVHLLEDAAHAPMATASGRCLGTWGVASAFSFFSNKVLAGGEGGLLATDDDEIAAFARLRRSHAMTLGSWDRARGAVGSYDVPALGFNYRLDEPRAALLLSRLRRLGEDIEQRRAITSRYRAMLAGLPGISVPFDDGDVGTSSCYVMSIMVDDAERRAPLRHALRDDHGIQTSVFYPAIHHLSAYSSRYPGISLPNTEQAAAREITIPMFPHMTESQQQRVVDALRAELSA